MSEFSPKGPIANQAPSGLPTADEQFLEYANSLHYQQHSNNMIQKKKGTSSVRVNKAPV